ncbi:hypothetical protein BDW67DRAFT_10758 [Aspergillus spinulosporus]
MRYIAAQCCQKPKPEHIGNARDKAITRRCQGLRFIPVDTYLVRRYVRPLIKPGIDILNENPGSAFHIQLCPHPSSYTTPRYTYPRSFPFRINIFCFILTSHHQFIIQQPSDRRRKEAKETSTMHLSISAAALLALSLVRPTVAGRPWFCPLALDAKFLQVPFCCEGFVPARDSKVSYEGVNCINVSSDEDFVKTCPKGGTPKCCYTIGPKVICTTEVGDGVDE